LSELERNPDVKMFSFFLNHKEQRDENEYINLNPDLATCHHACRLASTTEIRIHTLSATMDAVAFQFMQEALKQKTR
jgi:hypothetical protein